MKEEMGDGGERILLSCSLSCSPVAALRGLRGEKWLQDTLIRSVKLGKTHVQLLVSSGVAMVKWLGAMQ